MPTTTPADAPERAAFVTSITPFDAHGELDVDVLRAHLRRIAAAGTGLYVGPPSPGQAHALSREELATIYRVAGEELAGRVPLRASGLEPRTAAQLVDLAGLAQEAGLDAIQIHSLDLGHGAQPTEREIERYFRDVIEHVTLPVVLSTHFCMGWLVPPELMERLVREHEHVAGVTVTSHDPTYIGRMAQLGASLERPFDVHTANIGQAPTVLALGATGFLAAEGNVVPRLVASVGTHWAAGRHAEALAAWRRLWELFPLHFYGNSVRGWKAAMKLLGIPGWHHRPPVLPLDAEQEREVAAALARAGVDDDGH